MIAKVFVLAVLFLAFQARSISPQVVGEIVGQGGQKFPIAVSPLKNLGGTSDSGKLSEGIADAMVHDLDLSGWFKVLDRSAYIENPRHLRFPRLVHARSRRLGQRRFFRPGR